MLWGMELYLSSFELETSRSLFYAYRAVCTRLIGC